MLNTTKTIEDGVIRFALEGRLDTVTSPDFEAEIKDSFGDVQFIEGDESLGETAFITKVMTGLEFEKAAANFDIVSRIRVSD